MDSIEYVRTTQCKRTVFGKQTTLTLFKVLVNKNIYNCSK